MKVSDVIARHAPLLEQAVGDGKALTSVMKHFVGQLAQLGEYSIEVAGLLEGRTAGSTTAGDRLLLRAAEAQPSPLSSRLCSSSSMSQRKPHFMNLLSKSSPI